jgi:hypothetical protein
MENKSVDAGDRFENEVPKLPGGSVVFLNGPGGCIAGDTVLRIRRGKTKKLYRYTIEEFFNYFHGGRRKGLKFNWSSKPTQMMSHESQTGKVDYYDVENVIYSGVKPTIRIKTDGGRELTCTRCHPLLTPEGYIKAGDLAIGSAIVVRGSLKTIPTGKKRGRSKRVTVEGLKYYSSGYRKFVKDKLTGKVYEYQRSQRARLVIEAGMNGMHLDEYVHKLKTDPDFVYVTLDKTLVVHHKNENPMDDRPDNLQVMTKKEHDLHHAGINPFNKIWTGEDRISSIEDGESIKTYDIKMSDAHPNFILENGLIIHNSGKTYRLNRVTESLSNVLVVAFTGNAALLARGATAHSTFGIPTDGILDPNIPPSGVQRRRYTDKSTRFFGKKKTAVLAAASWIVVDEASMMRCDMLDFMDKVMRNAKKKPEVPFGGANVILVGDRGQIPPVITAKDRVALCRYDYEAPFDALSAKVFETIKIKMYHLTKIWRQENPIEANILCRVRTGTQTQADLDAINHNIREAAPLGATTLCATNAAVNRINERKLNELSGKLYTFTSKKSGSLKKKIKDAPIQLKIGARVIIQSNGESGSGVNKLKFTNGDQGVFEGVDKHGRLIIHRDRDGEHIYLKHKKLEDIDYYTKEELDYTEDGGEIVRDVICEKVKGRFSQFPVRLGYAMTGHKSQGQTLNKVHIVLGNRRSRVLDQEGVVYVMLSRVTSLKNLSLDRELTMADIKANPKLKDEERDQQFELL